MSLSRFKATLVGAAIADCIGATYEGQAPHSLHDLLRAVRRMEKNRQIQRATGTRPADAYGLMFTDDTAMTRSVAASLIEKKMFDAQDMAKRFSDEFSKEPDRGYGGGVISVFEALKDPQLQDVFSPAKAQFDGSGSYGNGGAMRIAPLPLFAYGTNKESELEDLASLITRLTHTHVLGVNGAVLQAFAIDQCLRLNLPQDLQADVFIDSLVDRIKRLEVKGPLQPSVVEQRKARRKLDVHPTPYSAKLEKMKELLQKDVVDVTEVIEELGHDVSAVGSVPTAIFAFLRAAAKGIPDLEERNMFEQTVLYAISLGGDTDTIATMAAAMAGALYGMDQIPEAWQYYSEGVADAETMAEKLFEIAGKPS